MCESQQPACDGLEHESTSIQIDALMRYQRTTEVLRSIRWHLDWDLEVMMPANGGSQRAEEIAALTTLIQERESSSYIGELIEQISENTNLLSGSLRHIKLRHKRLNKLPMELAAENVLRAHSARRAWWQARADGNIKPYLAALQVVIEGKRDEAKCLGDAQNPLDNLIVDYEIGLNMTRVHSLSEVWCPRLKLLRHQLLETERPKKQLIQMSLSEQEEMLRILANAFGFRLDQGRIDFSPRPMIAGSHSDVRVSTTFNESMPLRGLYSFIHELGHGCYEQSIDPALRFTPAGHGASYGVHEGQSRIFENYIGRSPGFVSWLYGIMKRHCKGEFYSNADELYKVLNNVNREPIRVYSDEVSYNLHIMLRVKLEDAIFSSGLDADELPSAWNDLSNDLLGFEVTNHLHGLLQDIHWANGDFGYFPTYMLGNHYAANIFAAIERDIPDIQDALGQGYAIVAVNWLQANLFRFGASFEPTETVERCVGVPLLDQIFIDKIEEKFRGIMGA